MYNRLLVHVEGHTEEAFVRKVLSLELYKFGYVSVQARRMGKSHRRSGRGGIISWPQARREIVHHLRQDKSAASTTMVDYFGLPQSGGGAWPGRAESSVLSYSKKADAIEDLLSRDVQSAMGPKFDTKRFIPFIMMHEFEALHFSNCDLFASAIDRPELGPTFQEILDAYDNPEGIDDSPATAPSKRILKLVPNFNKRVIGVAASEAIGVPTMRDACPHFATWWDRLVQLP